MQKIARRAGGYILAVFIAGCSGPSAPTAMPPLVGAVRMATVSGVVVEGTSPIGYARLGFLYNSYGPNVIVSADGNGAFRLMNVPEAVPGWLVAFKDGYAQPCAVPIALQGDTTVDVQLIARANLTGSSIPSSPAGFRTVSGVIVQITESGKQPVADASVVFEPAPLLDDWVVASTYSDANGRFSLCGLPQDAAWITTMLGSRFVNVTAQPGQNYVEITLP